MNGDLILSWKFLMFSITVHKDLKCVHLDEFFLLSKLKFFKNTSSSSSSSSKEYYLEDITTFCEIFLYNESPLALNIEQDLSLICPVFKLGF